VFAARERTILNLLLLGETGTGKSTWINAFANYVSFETLEDAEDAGGLFPIPAIFTYFNPKTYEEQIIATDKNLQSDDSVSGKSVTQEPRTYSFTHGALTVNVIDTPGLSSTEDALTETHNMDKQHVDKILHFVGRFNELHAICIVLKPNQSRITKSFAYCVTEILRNLHESASNNVIFIITNARSTNFKPGNTLSTLRTFLRENSLEERIKLTPDTMYCIENDTLQHIVEHIYECHHDEEAELSARKSWAVSVKTTTDMLAYIQSLKPHDVDGMQCIYNTRRLIGILSHVLMDIVKCSMTNSKTLEDKKKEIESRRKQIQNSPKDFVTEDLRSTLYSEIQKVAVKKLEHSNTVCKSPQCSVVVGSQRHFKQICCEGCKGLVFLWTCRAFEGIKGEKCRRCRCEKDKHEWQATSTELETEVLFDDSEEGIGKVLSRDDALRKLNDRCKKIEQYLSETAKERDRMLETGAILSLFLEQNALFSSSTTDNLGDCLRNECEAFEHALSQTLREKMSAIGRMQINDENEKRDVDDVNKYILANTQCKENLQKLIEEYDHYYKKASDSGKVFTTLEVCNMIDELYRLARDGETLKAAVLEVDRCQKLAIQDDESKTSIVIRKISKVWKVMKAKVAFS